MGRANVFKHCSSAHGDQYDHSLYRDQQVAGVSASSKDFGGVCLREDLSQGCASDEDLGWVHAPKGLIADRCLGKETFGLHAYERCHIRNHSEPTLTPPWILCFLSSHSGILGILQFLSATYLLVDPPDHHTDISAFHLCLNCSDFGNLGTTSRSSASTPLSPYLLSSLLPLLPFMSASFPTLSFLFGLFYARPLTRVLGTIESSPSLVTALDPLPPIQRGIQPRPIHSPLYTCTLMIVVP